MDTGGEGMQGEDHERRPGGCGVRVTGTLVNGGVGHGGGVKVRLVFGVRGCGGQQCMRIKADAEESGFYGTVRMTGPKGTGAAGWGLRGGGGTGMGAGRPPCRASFRSREVTPLLTYIKSIAYNIYYPL